MKLVMQGRADCQRCHGRGVVLGSDPNEPARLCQCTQGFSPQSQQLGIPSRYRNVHFEGFWDWWKIQHPKESVLAQLKEVQVLLNSVGQPMAAPLSSDLASKLDFLLHKCGSKQQAGEWKVKPAQEPEGFEAFQRWSKHGPDRGDLWWLEGVPGSGRSSLAAAALKAACARNQCVGQFVSVRTLSQELKDVYYDTRHYQKKDFQTERDQMTPLQQAPLLVLDDIDRMDADIRVVRAFAQLLDYRYAEERTTIVTSTLSFERLQALGAEVFPLARLEDPSLMRRLSHARRVVMQPMLARLLEKQGQHG